MFGPAFGVIRHWFLKRSGLALGVASTGSSLGGTVFAIVGQNLLPLVGCVSNELSACVMFNDIIFRFKWTVRVFGFIVFVALGIANIVSFNSEYANNNNPCTNFVRDLRL